MKKILISTILIIMAPVLVGEQDNCHWNLSGFHANLHKVVECNTQKPCTTFIQGKRYFVWCESGSDTTPSLWGVCDTTTIDGEIWLCDCDFGHRFTRSFIPGRSRHKEDKSFPIRLALGLNAEQHVFGALTTNQGVDNRGFIGGYMDSTAYFAVVVDLGYRFEPHRRIAFVAGGFGGTGYIVRYNSIATFFGGRFGLLYNMLLDLMSVGINYNFHIGVSDIESEDKISAQGISIEFQFK